jgi:hypothetical protein
MHEKSFRQRNESKQRTNVQERNLGWQSLLVTPLLTGHYKIRRCSKLYIIALLDSLLPGSAGSAGKCWLLKPAAAAAVDPITATA